jgi:O-antigen/teichoic acid export membrane protein
MKAYTLIELVIALTAIFGLWVGLTIFDLGVLFAISWMVGVSAAGALIFLILLMPHGPAVRNPDLELAGRMLSYGFRVYMATLIAYMVGRTNLLLVNSYLGTSEAGLYSVAVALADGIHLIPTVVAVNLFPRIARGLDFQYTAVVFRSVTFLFGLVCLISIPLVGPAIGALFGPAYDGTTDIYYWMLPGIFAYGTLNVLGYHFAARGFPLEAVLIWIPGMVINLGVVMLWMPGNDAEVAALATSIAYTMVLILHVRTFVKESGSYWVLVPRPAEVARLLAGAVRALRPSAAG